MFLPTHCPACRAVGAAPCASCVGRLRAAPRLALPGGIDAAVSLFAYDGVGRDLVTALKYRNHRDAISVLSAALAAAIIGQGLEPDLVTHVVTTAERRRVRGFDQAELLARLVARELGVTHRTVLRRLDAGHQTGRDVTARAAARFQARCPVPTRVLVVDDVRTTGSSLAGAAAALRDAGAVTVWAGTLAATPKTHPSNAVASSTLNLIDAVPATPGQARGG